MHRRLIPSLVLAVVVTLGCTSLSRALPGKWVGDLWTLEFKADGTFSQERGLLRQTGRYVVQDQDQVRLEYDGVAGAINKITEIITGPKPLLVVVKLNGDQLELTWPDGLKSRHTRQPK
jgi:hypothetical protein